MKGGRCIRRLASTRTREDRAAVALQIFPQISAGAVSRKQRRVGSFTDAPDVMEFVNSNQAQKLAHLGTSCPDHFIRTKIRPMYIDWNPKGDAKDLSALVDSTLETYRKEYGEYYKKHALVLNLSKMRDASPNRRPRPGVGMFTFGKNKTEVPPHRRVHYQRFIHVQGAGSRLRSKRRTPMHRKGPAGWLQPQAPASSPSTKTTSRSHPARPSASSTGRSRKPRSSASHLKKNSAAA